MAAKRRISRSFALLVVAFDVAWRSALRENLRQEVEAVTEDRRRVAEVEAPPVERAARRVAYAAGLVRGLDPQSAENTQRVTLALVEAMEALQEAQTELNRRQTALEDEWSSEEERGEEVEIACHRCGSLLGFDAALLDEEELELTCPTCGEVVYEPGDELVDVSEEDGEEVTEPGERP